jgi:hypothetical protein
VATNAGIFGFAGIGFYGSTSDHPLQPSCCGHERLSSDVDVEPSRAKCIMTATTGCTRPGPQAATSLSLLAVGLALLIAAAVAVGPPLYRTIFSPSIKTPGSRQLRLEPGKYMIYEKTGTTTGVGPVTVTHDNSVTIDPSQVRITASDGANVVVSEVTVNDTIIQGSRRYTAAVEFKVHNSGVYQIQINSAEHGQVLVARSIGDALSARWRWLAGGGVGGLLSLLGTVLLLVGVIRRNRASRVSRPDANPPQLSSPMATHTSAVPAGWFPDPSQPGRLRYWDGTAWTGHTH